MIRRSLKNINCFYVGPFKEENHGDVVYLLVIMKYGICKKVSFNNFMKHISKAVILIIDESDYLIDDWESVINPNNPIICEAGVVEFLDKLGEIDKSTYHHDNDLFRLKIKEK